MKVTSVIMLFLTLKVKASFFEDFTGAMSSVENAFGKLLNDVVSDVKITVHCTILAMEQVLAINGVMEEPISNKECYTDENNDKLDNESKVNNPNFYSAKNIAQEISSSISKVNKTLGNILDNNGHQRMEDIKRVLKSESNRLNEVSLLLRHELEKISHKLKTEIQYADLDSGKSSIESVKNDMEALYEAEKNDTNVSQEIGEVFNEALNVLHLNTLNEVKSDKDKINAIIQELEQESNNDNTPNNELSQWKEKEQSTLDSSLGHKSEEAQSYENTELFNQNIQIDNVGTDSTNADFDDYTPFIEQNKEETVKAMDQAMDIIQSNADTQAVLDDFLNKGQGADLFDNSNLYE